MKKQLPTLGVLGAYTGIVLKTKGFREIHEVLDHLFTGVTTIGILLIANKAAEEILRQIPEIEELGECDENNFEDYARRGLAKFGETMELTGPLETY